MDDLSLLRYTDAEDKSFGVVGMAIGLFIFNAEQYLSGISVDRSDIDSIEFTPDFQIYTPQSLSAKSVWNESVKRFQVTAGLLLSNVICRCYVSRRCGIDAKLRQLMLDCLLEEGVESCQLDADEVEAIFNKNCDYLSRAFRSPELAVAARQMADDLNKSRELSRDQILTYLK
ncbi:MAG: hypothetical protein J6R27_03185 [Muribaculaceae bacterium]|nr:hypothetical protein [Muribaculaceae bacterium]